MIDLLPEARAVIGLVSCIVGLVGLLAARRGVGIIAPITAFAEAALARQHRRVLC